MPIKVNEVKINTHQRRSALLFRRNTTPLSAQTVTISGSDLIQECHFNPWQRLVLNVLDKIGPIAYKHPKISAGIMKISEKMIKNSDSLESELRNI